MSYCRLKCLHSMGVCLGWNRLAELINCQKTYQFLHSREAAKEGWPLRSAISALFLPRQPIKKDSWGRVFTSQSSNPGRLKELVQNTIRIMLSTLKDVGVKHGRQGFILAVAWASPRTGKILISRALTGTSAKPEKETLHPLGTLQISDQDPPLQIARSFSFLG